VNINVINTVERSIKEFILAGKMFTSIDIANSIKKDGMWIRNREVAEVLRDRAIEISEDLEEEYLSTVIVVTNGHTANLYFPCEANPLIYSNSNAKAITLPEFESMHGKVKDNIFNVVNFLKGIFKFPKI